MSIETPFTNGLTTSVQRKEFSNLISACGTVKNSTHLAVGVSGGADSMALCILSNEWGRLNGVSVTALVVDHGLRQNSSLEAIKVSSWLKQLKINFDILTIKKNQPITRIQELARTWRFSAFNQWCRANGADTVLLGHTLEDQIETIFMRILANTGPDGLSGIRNYTRIAGLNIARPLLSVTKKRLIATCHQYNQVWIEDPSNTDVKFTRVVLRNLQPKIEQVGLSKRHVERYAKAMGRMRDVLDKICYDLVKGFGEVSNAGFLRLDSLRLSEIPLEIRGLLMGRILKSIGGIARPVRKKRIVRLCQDLTDRSVLKMTLGGCIIHKSENGSVLFYREYFKCAPPILALTEHLTRWDNRFEVLRVDETDGYIEKLGYHGWSQIKMGKKVFGDVNFLFKIPFAARLSLPVVRHLDGTLLIPHFVSNIDAGVKSGYDLPIAQFKPDEEWFCDLVFMCEDKKKIDSKPSIRDGSLKKLD